MASGLGHRVDGFDRVAEALALNEPDREVVVCYSVDKEASRLRQVGASPRQWEKDAGRLALPSLQNALSESWCGWAVSPPAFPGPTQVGQSRFREEGPTTCLDSVGASQVLSHVREVPDRPARQE
jgi:hypothetical protein